MGVGGPGLVQEGMPQRIHMGIRKNDLGDCGSASPRAETHAERA